MSGFIYAIPGGIVTEKKLEEIGLMGVFADVIPNFTQRGTAQGPGGGDCTLICIGDNPEQLYFKPEEQTWQPSLNGKYQVGIINGAKPTVKDLARENQINGHEVEMNGEKWLIPLARMFPEGTLLPQTMLIGKDGKIIKEPIPRYAEFSRKAETLWEDVEKILGWREGEKKLTEEEKISLIVDALGFNYRVGEDEINALKLITTSNLMNIYGAIVDLPTIIAVSKEAQKKTDPDKINDG